MHNCALAVAMTCDHALKALLAPFTNGSSTSVGGPIVRFTAAVAVTAPHAPTCVSQIANAIADEMYLRLCFENCDKCMSLQALCIQRRMIADVERE